MFNPSLKVPPSKRFFKISELAGKRWPGVTEDDIFNWHDAGCDAVSKTHVPVEKIVDRNPGDGWDHFPFLGYVNLLCFWMFFPEFYSMQSYSEYQNIVELQKKDFDLEYREPQMSVEVFKKLGVPFPYNVLLNQFFMIPFDFAKGFAFNVEGVKNNCLLFYDERGECHVHGFFYDKEKQYLCGPAEINKHELLLKSTSVQLLEQIAPEITKPEFNRDALLGSQQKNDSILRASVDECNTPDNKLMALESGGRILEGWKAIASYAGVSVSTAKRHYKNIVRWTKTNRIIITTNEIDAYRLRSARRKNKK